MLKNGKCAVWRICIVFSVGPCANCAVCSFVVNLHSFCQPKIYQCIWIFVSPVLHWRQLQLVKKKHLLVSLEEALWRFAVKKLNQQHPMEMMLQKPQNEALTVDGESLSQMKSRALWWYTSETLNWLWKDRLLELEEIFLFHKNDN